MNALELSIAYLLMGLIVVCSTINIFTEEERVKDTTLFIIVFLVLLTSIVFSVSIDREDRKNRQLKESVEKITHP